MQKPFDPFAKRLFTAAWEGTGVVQTDAEILVDAQFTDVPRRGLPRVVWFEPDPARDAERAERGWVGAMGRERCGLEVFRRTPDVHEVFEGLRKQLGRHHARVLEAKRNKQPVSVLPPVTWVVSSGHPTTGMALMEQRPMPGWPSGFYQGVPGGVFRVVVVSELPATRDTLVLRLLGTGAVRRAALVELLALPRAAWEWGAAVPALVDLRMLLAVDMVTYAAGSEEQEFLMTTQNLYEEWARKVRQEGYEQCEREAKNRYEEQARKLRHEGELDGIQKGEREALTRLFVKRLGHPLTCAEQQTVALRHEKFGLSRLEDVALELRGEALAAWLADLAGA